MLKLAGFLRGSVTIIVDGFFTERFINLCKTGDIFLYDIKALGETRIRAKIIPSDFKRLKKIARKTKSRVKICEKKGLCFLLFRYRKRKPAIIGGLLLILMLFFFSGHLMGVNISGNERVETKAIEAALSEFGVFPLAPIRDINSKAVQNKMMIRFDEISWIGINIRGSRAYIEIKERLKTDPGVSLEVPCDLVAAKSGIIDSLQVREGQTLVKNKEFVEEGDLLVSGAIDSQRFGIRYVHAYGEVLAVTEAEQSGEYLLEFTEKEFTGREKTKYSLSLFGRSLRLYLREAPEFKLFEEKGEKKGLLEKRVYKEQRQIKIKRTPEEAFKIGKEEISGEIKKSLSPSAEILNISAKYDEMGENKLLVTVKFTLRENIAVQRAIDKIENLDYDIRD